MLQRQTRTSSDDEDAELQEEEEEEQCSSDPFSPSSSPGSEKPSKRRRPNEDIKDVIHIALAAHCTRASISTFWDKSDSCSSDKSNIYCLIWLHMPPRLRSPSALPSWMKHVTTYLKGIWAKDKKSIPARRGSQKNTEWYDSKTNGSRIYGIVIWYACCHLSLSLLSLISLLI